VEVEAPRIDEREDLVGEHSGREQLETAQGG
jgi:hypothetical protein